MKWLDIEEIAESLEDKYPDVDIVNLRYTDFHKWIVSLEEFDDDVNKSSERILEAIHSKWLEVRGS